MIVPKLEIRFSALERSTDKFSPMTVSSPSSRKVQQQLLHLPIPPPPRNSDKLGTIIILRRPAQAAAVPSNTLAVSTFPHLTALSSGLYLKRSTSSSEAP
ncbi:uncharacterized protein LAJ45_11322 [Morchella importuna]|uniref:uncharacterized protein n=1 Tax=Morchella importuna TaxID=1174673 RepID=UPI001E8CF841|nr:uncharacterized protein LAJ45_11322 [Morchella importuna]KAH8144661.1 hypothetical protein LAJ45_11322 [Morchella importuna]